MTRRPDYTKPVQGLSLDDFWAHLPTKQFIFMPTGAMWVGSGVDACLPPVPLVKKGKPVINKKTGQPQVIKATKWLERYHPVHHLAWAPGSPSIMKNQLLIDGQWVKRTGVVTYNFYRPSTLQHGDSKNAGPWLELVKKLYPKDYRRIVNFFAHCVQHPGTKINHGLVLGGKPGIGKDTLIEPLKRAVGSWNCREVSPSQLLGRFNGYLKSVVLRVSEMRDLGDVNRYALYEDMKILLAAPPDALRVDEKNIPEHDILNCVALVMTTNHLTDGMFLLPDDRRHDVMWSDLSQTDFDADYFRKIWKFYEGGGDGHVAAYLASVDLSRFDPKAPPPKTAAFWQIVDANRAPEEGELADIIDDLGRPDALTIKEVTCSKSVHMEFSNWLQDRRNRRAIPHRFEQVGYVRARNDDTEDGLWRIDGVRQAVYARSTLSRHDQIVAAKELVRKTDAAAVKSREEAAKKISAKGNGTIGVRF